MSFRDRVVTGLAYAVPAALGLLVVLGLLWPSPTPTVAHTSDPEAYAEQVRQARAAKEAAASAAPTLTWRFVGSTCADGWHSPSIGQRGACSWHGGAVSVYVASDGNELRCRDGGPPRTRSEQVDQMTSDRWSGTFWCE